MEDKMKDKLKPITLSKDASFDELFDFCYQEFKDGFLAKDNHPYLRGKEVVAMLHAENWVENKAEAFWHASSLDLKPEVETFPCTNDIAISLCNENCRNGAKPVSLSNGDIRMKCLYRASRVNFISETIKLCNAGDSRVKYWEKNNSKEKRMYLRYQEDELDYLVVLKHKSDRRAILITGFPVFYRKERLQYDKEYERFVENKNR